LRECSALKRVWYRSLNGAPTEPSDVPQSPSGDLVSWGDITTTHRDQGHDIAYELTEEDPYWLRNMFAYFEAHTCFGPNAGEEIALARDVVTEPIGDSSTWASANMPFGL
jgi:hypothetical protein